MLHGKSDIVNKSVNQAAGELILSHLVCSDPTDFKGYPFPVENSHADFLPFSDLLELMDANGVGGGPGTNLGLKTLNPIRNIYSGGAP